MGNDHISTRRFSGDKRVSANDIAQITFFKGNVIIEGKNKRVRWMFSRLFHLYNLDEMMGLLETFARKNKVTIVNEIDRKAV